MKNNSKIFITNPDRDNIDEFIYGLMEINNNIKITEEKLYYNENYFIDLHYLSI